MNKNEQIAKSLKNEYDLNNIDIKQYNSKIDLLSSTSNKYITSQSMAYTIGISIVLSMVFIFINKSNIIDYKLLSLINLTSSTVLGSIYVRIKSIKNKKKLKQISFSKGKMIEEEKIRYSLEKQKILDYNSVIKKMIEDINNDEVTYLSTNELGYISKEELLNSINNQLKNMDIRQQKFEKISSKKYLNDLNFNSFIRYIQLTLLSIGGIFSVCYLPSINLSSNEVLKYCIELSLVVNIPINLLTIKNIYQDKKLYKKLDNELNCNLKNDDIELEYKKLNNEIYASKFELLNEQLVLSSNKELIKENNNYYKIKENEKDLYSIEDIEENIYSNEELNIKQNNKNKVLTLKK